MLRHTLIAATVLFAGISTTFAADPRLAGYRHPAGWDVSIAASEPLVINPVTMTFGTDGRLYVIEWKAGRGPNDLIKVLTDTDGDGTFEKSEIFMEGLDLPAGLLFWDGWAYITLEHDVVRFKDKDGDGKFEVREVIASGFGNDNSHHRVSGLAMGPDGWIYMTTGDSDAHAKGSDGSTADVLRCGGVFRCRPDGSQMQNVAFGMRNPWGNVAWDDEFNMFHTDNDNEGSPGFTGCRILHVVEGGDYGWRLREGARCCAPDFERATWNGGRPGRLGWIAETGRGAPAGLCVLNSAALPPSTRNMLVYPDVFRKLVRAYKLKPAGSTYSVAEEIELLASDEGLFRPTDAEIGPDGALYILDWRTDSGGAGQLSGNGTTGRIYRMTWSGTPSEPARKTLPRDRFVELLKGEDSALIAALKSDDLGLRKVASQELIRRGNADRDALITDRDRKKAIETRCNALFEIVRANETSSATVLHATAILNEISETSIDRSRLALLASKVADEVFFEGGKDGRPSGLPGKAQLAWLSGTRMKRGQNISSPAIRRYAYESIGRFNDPNDDWLTLYLLWSEESDPAALRSLARALGRFSDIRRAKPNENPAVLGLDDEYRREWTKASEMAKTAEERMKATDAIEKKYRDVISVELIAAKLLHMAEKYSSSDSFLRDAITRGLENLGPVGVEAVVKAISSKEKLRATVALYALQGWRSASALNAILAEATSTEASISDESRVELFRTLREMVDQVPPEPIVNWLKESTGTSPKARVQALQVLTAMHARAVLAVGPALAGLLVDANSDVRRQSLVLAREVRSSSAKDVLITMVKSTSSTDEERGMALSALRGYDGLDLAPLVRDLIPNAKDPGFKLELVRTLSKNDFPAAAKLAESLLNESDRTLRHEAIAMLGSKPDFALTIANRYLDGKLPPEDLSRVIDAVRPHATPELQQAMQTLLKKTLLAAPTGDDARRFRDFVTRQGDANRGKAVFTEAKKGSCVTCHRLEGIGGSVGPDLTRVYETLSFEKRVESILEPSKEIKEGFATFKVATHDGRVLTGLLLSDTAEAVTLRDAEGKELRILSKDIEEKKFEKTSLMPVGVVGHLSLNDLADLLAFLGDRKTQESLRTSPSPTNPR